MSENKSQKEKVNDSHQTVDSNNKKSSRISRTARSMGDFLHNCLKNFLGVMSQIFNVTGKSKASDRKGENVRTSESDLRETSMSDVLAMSENLWIVRTTFTTIQKTLLWLADVSESVQQWLTHEILTSDDPQNDLQNQRHLMELLGKAKERLQDTMRKFRQFMEMQSEERRQHTFGADEMLESMGSTKDWHQIMREFDALFERTNSEENAFDNREEEPARDYITIAGCFEPSEVTFQSSRENCKFPVEPDSTKVKSTFEDSVVQKITTTPEISDEEKPSPSWQQNPVLHQEKPSSTECFDCFSNETELFRAPEHTQSDFIPGSQSSRLLQNRGVFRPRCPSYPSDLDNDNEDNAATVDSGEWSESEVRKADAFDNSAQALAKSPRWSFPATKTNIERAEIGEENEVERLQSIPILPYFDSSLEDRGNSPRDKPSEYIIADSQKIALGQTNGLFGTDDTTKPEQPSEGEDTMSSSAEKPDEKIVSSERKNTINSSAEKPDEKISSSERLTSITFPDSDQDDDGNAKTNTDPRKNAKESRNFSFSGYMFYPGMHGFVILDSTRPRKTVPSSRHHKIICLDTTKLAETVAERFRTLLQDEDENSAADVVGALLECCKDSIHFSTLTVPSTQDCSSQSRSSRKASKRNTEPTVLGQITLEICNDSGKTRQDPPEETPGGSSSNDNYDMLSDIIDESIRLVVEATENEDLQDVEIDEKWSRIRDSFSIAAKSMLNKRDSSVEKETNKKISSSSSDIEPRSSDGRRVRFQEEEPKVCIYCACEDIENPERAVDFSSSPMLHPNHDTLPEDVVEVREFVDGKLRVFTEKCPSFEKDEDELLKFHSRWASYKSSNNYPSSCAGIDVLKHGSDSKDASIRVIYPVTKYLPKAVRSRSLIRHPRTFSKIMVPRDMRQFDPYLLPTQIRYGNAPLHTGRRSTIVYTGGMKQQKVPDANEKTSSARDCCPTVTVLWNFLHDIHKAGYLQGPPLMLKLNEDNAVNEAMEALMFPSRISLGYYNDIWVRFKDDSGAEAMSEKCQWLFTEFSRVFFNPGRNRIFDYPSESSSVIHLNPMYKGDRRAIRFAGMVLALAVLHGKHINVKLPAAFFKCLLDRPFTVKDLAQIDPILFVKLEWIKQNDLSRSNVNMTFKVKEVTGNRVYYQELIPNGSDIAVTDSNKEKFIEKAVIWKLAKRCFEQLKEFRRGFISVLDPFLLSVFTAEELEFLTSTSE